MAAVAPGGDGRQGSTSLSQMPCSNKSNGYRCCTGTTARFGQACSVVSLAHAHRLIA